MSVSLPWHEAQSQVLLTRLRENRFPHALLLTGRPGLGKHVFSGKLAEVLLCLERHADGSACGKCRGCQLYRARTHPDLHEVNVLEDKKFIGVDQIRAISDYLSLKSQFGGYKIVIISPADKMNINAANSLLKTLEEPPMWSLLILVTAHPASLPPTIRSRCQQLSFVTPPKEVARAWLKEQGRNGDDLDLALGLSGGAPLAALAVATGDWLERRQQIFEGFEKVLLNKADPITTAAEWLKFDARATIYWLYSWITDMIRLRTGNDSERIINGDIGSRLQQLSGVLTPQSWFKCLDEASDAWRYAESQVNTPLLFENLLVAWANRK
ncbi:MAG: DNA polymerase III subunit delta' [Gammaproteobacteria bacterium]|nr:MAG: DNA polymerase III subunit delta' [Gammaproteobacteria bacterium]TND06866.1 MAG: DNA polymerase III subunit delta' [Gammaproteobacteria bacterium]